MYAFKAGVSVLDADTLNNIITTQSFDRIRTGTARDQKYGAGATENSLAINNYCMRFTLVGSTELSRVWLNVDKDGAGQDLVVQIRSGMVPASGTDGTMIKEVAFPKEFIALTAGGISIPFNLTGLTSGGTYWIVVKKAGDLTDKNDLIGEAAQDGSYPAFYRAADSGNWTANNAIHFYVYSGDTGLPIHTVYDGNAYTIISRDAGNKISVIKTYVPPPDGSAGGIRQTLTLTRVNGRIKKGVVT